MSAAEPADAEADLQVRVIPRAGRTALGGWRGDVLIVRLAAAPVDGAANQALTEFFARLLEVPRTSVSIAAGERSRNKRVRIAHLSPARLAAKLTVVCPR
jgi:uncharacterized protein (TIGR00251 family)